MTDGEIRELLRHMEWADAQVWRAVLARPESHGDAFLRERLHHIHDVQWAYLHVWRSEAANEMDLTTFADLGAIRSWGRSLHREMREQLASMREETIRDALQVPWSDHLVRQYGKAEPTTFVETVLQVVSHSTYHRGQVNTRLRELGGDPPLVDFIVWIWSGRPAADWADATDADASGSAGARTGHVGL